MKYFVIFAIVVLMLTACSKDDGDQQSTDIMELNIPDGFDFSVEQKVAFSLTLYSNTGLPTVNIPFKLFHLPANLEEYTSLSELNYLQKGQTDLSGSLSAALTVPACVTKIIAVGYMRQLEIDINNGKAEYIDGGNMARDPGEFYPPPVNRDYVYVEGLYYDGDGVPSPMDFMEISPELMEEIDTSLPEYISLPESHPQYLVDGITSHLIIEVASEVWITFVSEGAGYKNSLGYYIYDQEDGPPENPESLQHVIVFPNCSFQYSGGNLHTGDRVYLGEFPDGTVMGWFLIQNGWIDGPMVDTTKLTFYSDKQFNPESEEYNQHQVLLYEEENEVLLLGFEDLVRPGGDNDFNDAVFFVQANPIENIDLDNIPPIDPGTDFDGDGVNDPFDDYPEDNQRAFRVYYPAEDQFSSIVFEDKWPAYGDYDMNDLVMDYHYMLVTNADDEVKDIKMNFRLRAAGAFYDNGFSVLLPFENSNIENSTSSDNVSPEYVTEGSYTIVDLFSHFSDLTGLTPGTFFNTKLEDCFYEAVAFMDSITFINPIPIEDLDFSFPFNPFLRCQGDQDYEIHLMNYLPTSRHNSELFLTEDDDSNPAQGEYYVSPANLPWALNLPESWKYPVETEMITDAYLYFGSWAESGGTSFTDWYLPYGDQVNWDNIYIEP